jgi:hypothetical protein
MEPIDNSNIDGRLAAIAMNLELLSRDREDDKRRIEALLEATARNTDAIARNTEAIARNTEAIGALTAMLSHFAAATDARLKRLEGQQQ